MSFAHRPLHGLGFSLACILSLPCHALASSHMVADKAITCTYGQKNPMSSGEARLAIKNKLVYRIWFNSYFPGGRGQLGYLCHIDLNRGDRAYDWQDKGTELSVTAIKTGDTLQLNHDKRGYNLDFSHFKTLSKYCGAGAELPLDVLIPLSGKPCKIRLP